MVNEMTIGIHAMPQTWLTWVGITVKASNNCKETHHLIKVLISINHSNIITYRE